MSQDLNDCYFFYYSSCNKGKGCPFRHEPSARGSEQTCEDWEFGRCTNPKCPKRHMVITVKRTEIACYWENQPGGCQKPHCVFKHHKDKEQIKPNILVSKETLNNDDIPSPKIDPVLITAADDTDEESPQKAPRIKPVISNTTKTVKKKISLKGTKPSVTEEDLMIKKLCKNSNELEQEILEQAKKGLAEARSLGLLGPDVEAPTRSLREWKKEKILRAKLEMEKRRQALEIEKNKSPDSIRHVIRKDNGITVIKPAIDMKRQLYPKKDITQPAEKNSCESGEDNEVITLDSSIEVIEDPVPVLNMKSDPASLKIKTLEEIREEKRKRKLEQEEDQVNKNTTNIGASVTVAKQAKLVEKQNVEKQQESRPAVIIPTRKMKIRSKQQIPSSQMLNSKPIKLKRSSFVKNNSIEQPEQVETNLTSSDLIKVRKNQVNKPKNELTIVSTSPSSTPPEAVRQTCSQSSTDHMEELKSCTPLTAAEGSPTNPTQSDDEFDDESEDDLLGESTYLEPKSYSSPTAGNIIDDDDDLMNEMEELLA